MISPLDKAIPNWGAPTLQGFDVPNDVQDGQRIGSSSKRQFVVFYHKKFLEVYADKVEVNERTGSVKVLKTATREVVREMVKIITPGDKNEVDDFAQDFHRREHWIQYKLFRDGKSGPIGVPIDECDFIPQGIATELRYLGVHSLEQFADGSDLLCNQVANGWELREYARAIVKANRDNESLGEVNILKGELEKSQEVIRLMQEQMNEMKGMLLDAQGKPVQFSAPVAGPVSSSVDVPEGVVAQSVPNRAPGTHQTSPQRPGNRR